MRFHRLTMTAFGPYADTQTLDFEELNEAGIFLLTGPTGAGKTSILDALCFALYGVVPGVREVRSLRSHHAAEGVAPEVVLEATIGDRRLRIRRSPEWHRPKKRGDGVTKENACATLTVLEDDGTERFLSSRIAEVGHELTTAVGMSSEQFMQVVMLPQGDFQRFLQATSDERQSVLQKLFRTQRFARIEDWMRDRTRDLGARADEAEKEVCQLLGTIADRAEVELPETLQGSLRGSADEARTWAAGVLCCAEAEQAAAVVAEALALEASERARCDDLTAARLAEAAARRAAAEGVLAELFDSEATSNIDHDVLRRHRAALLVRPLLQPLAELDRQLDEARTAEDVAISSVAAMPDELRPVPVDKLTCAATLRHLLDRLAVLRSALPREASLAKALSALDNTRDALAAHEEELGASARRTETLPEERDEVQQRLDDARLLAHGLKEARAALGQARTQHDAVTALPRIQAVHDELTRRSLDARELAATARERHLAVLERRLAGMAAELAQQLADGDPCQVCGSLTHPDPARADADAVTEQDQLTAEHDAERLRAAAEALGDRLAESTRELQTLETAAAGLDLAGSESALAACLASLAAAEAAAGSVAQLEARVAALEEEDRSLSVRLQEIRSSIASTQAHKASLQATCEELTRELVDAVGDGGGAVAAAITRHEEAVATLERAITDWEAVTLAEARLTEARTLADQEAQRHDFSTALEAERALLPAAVAEELEDSLHAREQSRCAALAVVEEGEVGDVPDLSTVRAALADATETWRLRTAELSTAADRRTSLATLVSRLDVALTAWQPAREEHTTAEAMARLVRGMGGDNHLQMRLSSYVLATRLDQVLDAANERLGHMRDQRYSLRRCGKTRGGARAGLGLEVLDTWTGEARAPSTLSGGETFVVSLALALGLADVVAQESGGARVDTLFIDEGFGMLDPETLDDVMDRIDALRAGGRTVGVVSHVTELRGRIPTQVHVERGRTGSRVSVRTLVA
jgi:exonuclease SbcC